jgi:hypothetical protein
MGWVGLAAVDGNLRKGVMVYIVGRLVWVRLGRLVQVVRFDWTSWVCAESTPKLSICVIYIYIYIYIYGHAIHPLG